MYDRLREMSRQQRRPWVFGDEEEEEEVTGAAAGQNQAKGAKGAKGGEDEEELHRAIVESVMQLSLDEERRKLAGRGREEETTALRDDEASALDQWMREPFNKRANEVLSTTREGRKTKATAPVSSSSSSSSNSNSRIQVVEDDEDEELKRALEASKKEYQEALQTRMRSSPGGGAAAAAAGAAGGAGAGDLELALRLSQDPAQQISSEMRHLLQAVMESKKDHSEGASGAAATATAALASAADREEEAQMEQDRQQLEMVLDLSRREAAIAGMMAPVEEARELRRVPGGTRPVIIDGNNVAWCHGNHDAFSANGILICINYFLKRGHHVDDIWAFAFRNQRGGMTAADEEVVQGLVKAGFLKLVSKKHYDDLYILRTAKEKGGIVVSNDRFQDVAQSHPEMEATINELRLGFQFLGDDFVPAEDPLGRQGPKLDDFLRFPS